MFKFKNKTYTLNDVQSAAEDSNLSLDDYIVKVGIETDEDDSVKTNGVADGCVCNTRTKYGIHIGSWFFGFYKNR